METLTNDGKKTNPKIQGSPQQNSEFTTTAHDDSTQSKAKSKLPDSKYLKDANKFLSLVAFTHAGHWCSFNKEIYNPDMGVPNDSRGSFYPGLYDKGPYPQISLDMFKEHFMKIPPGHGMVQLLAFRQFSSPQTPFLGLAC